MSGAGAAAETVSGPGAAAAAEYRQCLVQDQHGHGVDGLLLPVHALYHLLPPQNAERGKSFTR